MSRNARLPEVRLGYRPELDGLRGIAILSVVSMHAFNWPRGGFLGVDLFFVLSGFLITTLLVEEWRSHGSISLRAFYRRRALRLIPGLVVVVGVYVILSLAIQLYGSGPASHHLCRHLAGALAGIFYVSNIVQAAGAALPRGIRHLWSLGTEEQFYLLWPPILLLTLSRVRTGTRRLQLFLGIALAVVVVWRLALTLGGASQHRLYFAPDTSCDTLIVGCILGLWFATDSIPHLLRKSVGRHALHIVGVATVVGLMFATRDWSDRSLFAGTITLFALASATLIAIAVLEPRSLLGRLLRLQPLVFTGRISYSLYLWHPIILTQTRLAPLPAVVASFLVATLSYYVVERPFLRMKREDRRIVVSAPNEARLPLPAQV
jgi:peptidoglycan/LPS O-acetylase OafA/YrhL